MNSAVPLDEKRTNWSEDRTILTNERTFASWMRTGMACIGVALGLRAVFGATDHPMIVKAVAELFIITAVIIFASAAKRTHRADKRVSEHDMKSQSHVGMIVTSTSLAIGAIAAGVILWLL